jgi:DNA-binding transcriptional MerR regulator
VIESLNQLRESPDYELCQLSGQKSGVLDDLASERARRLDQESAELEKQAERLAEEIKELSGKPAVEFLEELFTRCEEIFHSAGCFLRQGFYSAFVSRTNL